MQKERISICARNPVSKETALETCKRYLTVISQHKVAFLWVLLVFFFKKNVAKKIVVERLVPVGTNVHLIWDEGE